MKKRKAILSIFISALIHSTLFVTFSGINFNFNTEIKKHKFNLSSIRRVGKKTGKKNFNIPIKKKTISMSDLQAPVENIQEPTKKKFQKAIKNLSLADSGIKEFLKKPSQNMASATKILQKMDGDTDILIDMEVPKGVNEDELNKHELVFYSFQKRTIAAYINSFRKELNEFKRTKPHLKFPLTRSRQRIASRITYDKNGDILKIETIKWTNVQGLQTFFMDVMKNLTSIPNPPEQIVENDQFVINYVFTVNN